MWKPLVLGAIGSMLLAACASVRPIRQDQPLALAPGDGIAAVQFYALSPLTQAQIVSAHSGGETMNIPSVPAGPSTYLFDVPAGRYCLQRFWVGKLLIFHKGQYVDCFDVPAGALGLSGIYTPHWVNGEVMASRSPDFAYAVAQLKREYPRIAAQFLPPESAAVATDAVPSTAPPSGTHRISAWVVRQTYPLEDTVYLRNNSKWAAIITRFELYNCANVLMVCMTMHPYLELLPHQTRVFIQIPPADPQESFTFDYRYYFRTYPVK